MPQAMGWRCIGSFMVVWSLIACGDAPPTREWTPADHGQPEAAPTDRLDDARDESPPDAEDNVARAARALWTASCMGCHGADGRGQGEARPPGAQVPDFTLAAWQSSRTDVQLSQTIHDGRGMMPAFGKQLNESGISALVGHIRGLRVEAAPTSGSGAGAVPDGSGAGAPRP
jgi:mono/diheme cytochrome c family protein